jgi:hypothetical protein
MKGNLVMIGDPKLEPTEPCYSHLLTQDELDMCLAHCEELDKVFAQQRYGSEIRSALCMRTLLLTAR